VGERLQRDGKEKKKSTIGGGKRVSFGGKRRNGTSCGGWKPWRVAAPKRMVNEERPKKDGRPMADTNERLTLEGLG
jgi:hypothetical protein